MWQDAKIAYSTVYRILSRRDLFYGVGSHSRLVYLRTPTVLRVGPYRFFFYTGDGDEPPHVHVESDDCEANFSLGPARLERSGVFRGKVINRIREVIEEHRQQLFEGWNAFFGG